MIRKAVGAIIVNDKDQYLLVHKVKIKDSTVEVTMDSWDFVKGGIKDGESVIQALKRELYEETGIENYEVIEELYDKICFDFPAKISKINNFQSQETTMFLVKALGENKNLNSTDDEIDLIQFFNIHEIGTMLNTEETLQFWWKYLSKYHTSDI